MLSSNIDIMCSLSDFYRRLSRITDSGPASKCEEDIEVFSNDLGNIINNFQLQVNRSKALVKILTDRTEMVKQHRLERLNQHMESEAVVVRIVAIVTLVYLPATFTSVGGMKWHLLLFTKYVNDFNISRHSSARTSSSTRAKSLPAESSHKLQ